MAAIGYSINSAFGSKVASAVQDLRDAQARLLRTKQVADDVTAGGTQTANLESNTLFSVSAGKGQAFYDAIVSINSAIQSLQAITDLDQG